jgi:hypothetical protein
MMPLRQLRVIPIEGWLLSRYLYSPSCLEEVSLLRNAVQIGACNLEESRKRR